MGSDHLSHAWMRL